MSPLLTPATILDSELETKLVARQTDEYLRVLVNSRLIESRVFPKAVNKKSILSTGHKDPGISRGDGK